MYTSKQIGWERAKRSEYQVVYKNAKVQGGTMIEELLDKYHVDDFDDLLIEIINHMKEQKETREQS